jgi:hypothetical protein
MESCIVSPAVEAEGVGGKGRISCAVAVDANTMPNARVRRVSIVFRFMVVGFSVLCEFTVTSLTLP